MAEDDVTERILEIVRRLYEQTKSGSITWDRGGRSDQFVYSTRTASVVLESKDRDGLMPFTIRVANSNGDPIGSAEIDPFSPHSPIAEELYKMAGRKALRVDETLNELLSELEEPPF